MESYSLLIDVIVLLAVAIPVSFLFQKLKLPTIIGFLATGIIAGPHGAGLVSGTEAVQSMAELGVVLLLFTIGLEFSLKQVFSGGLRTLLPAILQVLLTILVSAGISYLLGFELRQGIFLGFLFALSSTAIVLKILSDRAEVDTPQGRIAVSILLFQDLCVIPMMLLVPSLSGSSVDFLQVGKQLILAALTVGLLFIASRYLVPILLKKIVPLRNRDLFIVTVLFVCLGTAYLSAYMGLSLAIGAFIAGLVISESEYSHQIVSDILPFRDAFNALFFMSIGMLLDFNLLLANWKLDLAVAASIFIGKTILIFLVLLLTKNTFRVSLITAISLAQVGEFSFLLAAESSELYILSDFAYQQILVSIVLTMLLTPFGILAAIPLGMKLQHLFKWTGDSGVEEEKRKELKNHLIVIGFGLNGKNLSGVVREVGIPFIVVELNDRLVKEARTSGFPVLFGDASRKEVLHEAGAENARMVVIAISDPGVTLRTVSVCRSLNRNAVIIVRTRYAAEVDSLTRLGANVVIPEEFETSIEIFARVLQEYDIPEHLIEQQISIIRSSTYAMLRGLSLSQERLLEISELMIQSTIQNMILGSSSPVIGKTLRELSLRTQTGATILAVIRDQNAITNPGGDYRFQENDVLVLWGGHQQLADAIRLIKGETHADVQHRGENQDKVSSNGS